MRYKILEKNKTATSSRFAFSCCERVFQSNRILRSTDGTCMATQWFKHMKSWSPTQRGYDVVMISGTYYKVWNLVEESNSRKLHLPLKTIHQMFTFQFVYRSVSQSRQCHRPSFSSTDSPRYTWHPRLMGRSVNVWQIIIDHRLSRFYS